MSMIPETLIGFRFLEIAEAFRNIIIEFQSKGGAPSLSVKDNR